MVACKVIVWVTLLAGGTSTFITRAPRLAQTFHTRAVRMSAPAPPELVAAGRSLVQDSLRIIQDVGLPATIRRTIVGQSALLRTTLELSRELPVPPLPPLQRLDPAGLQQVVTDYVTGLPPDLAPKYLRRLFERLGSTYIKLGQFIASSPTLFPEEYVVEFQRCLDDAPVVPFAQVRKTVEGDLGKPMSSVFKTFQETPLASASVAQVHAATLLDGRSVVVKVRKEGVEDTLRTDLGFLEISARLLQTLAPNLKQISLADIVGDLRTSILGELDFRQELKCLQQFRDFLQNEGLTSIASAPRPYPEFSNKKVLTMDRVDGVSLVDLESLKAAGIQDPEQTLINALNVWSLSVVKAPFFHADVHAGNLLVTQDGRVCFIDFGIVGVIPPAIFDGIGTMGVAVAEGNWEAVAQSMVDIGAADGAVDVAAFGADLREVVTQMDSVTVEAAAGAGPDSVMEVAPDSAMARLASQVVLVADRNGVKLPREFGVLLKQVLYFDRYTRLLAPGLDLVNDERVQLQNPGGGVYRGPDRPRDSIDVTPSS